jgi:hypothetical protein
MINLSSIEMGGAYGMNDGKRNVFRVLVGKTEGKRPVERHRRGYIFLEGLEKTTKI